MEDRDPLPSGLDPHTPTDTRLYDFATGGKDNFAADRATAEALFAANPVQSLPPLENRRFLRRAVRFLLREGVRQFLDLGCGMPGRGNVHELAHSVDPQAAVAYIDYDPVVVSHYSALLKGVPTATVIHADARGPDDVLKHPEVTTLIDFDRPIGLLMTALLYTIPDDQDPYGLVAHYRDALAPGSHLVLSHYTGDGKTGEQLSAFQAVIDRLREPVRLRSQAETERFFDGFELVEPGVVTAPDWRPDRPHLEASGWLLAGVARIAPDPNQP